MGKHISVIIPNYNGGPTLGKCLGALFASRYKNFEVIVADDCSTDNSVEIIRGFPCRLVRLENHSGASRARNAGAENSTGEVLFFMDADCVPEENTLAVADAAITGHEETVFGGTYTRTAYDDGFFSTFQSIFIHYSETKKSEPDYIASHAMLISRDLFKKSGGFPEDFLPILEDVEFSHRLRSSGIKLRMNPGMLVRHIFNFTLTKSLKNAFRKSLYWVIYSLKNRDVFADSGTASLELKTNVVSFFLIMLLAPAFMTYRQPVFALFIPVVLFCNLFINRNLISAFYEAKGGLFAFGAAFYYTMVYPLAVGAGSLAGIARYYLALENRGNG